jgi:hypothetical protein
MMKLEEALFGAASAGAANECAAAAVAEPNRALDFGRDMSRVGDRPSAAARPIRSGQLPLS